MEPPKNIFLSFKKSIVIQVPASIIILFEFGYNTVAAAANAILSLPKV